MVEPSTSAAAWPWPRLGAAALLAVAGWFATRGAWEDIRYIATRDEEMSHIWLVPFLAAWLVWIRRRAVAQIAPRSSLIGPLIVAAGWALSHYGFYAARQSPWHLGALLVVIGCVTTVIGAKVLLKLWPALLVLVMLVPVPAMVRQKISIPLERVTASATTGILQLVDAPISRAGNVMRINGHDVTVAEACNGLRMIFPLFLIVYVFCFTLPLRASVRWGLLLAGPLVAVACNVIRLIPTVCLYGYASKSTAETFHDYSGWFMVPIAFILLMVAMGSLSAFGIQVMTDGRPDASDDGVATC